jgi:hypothetical protein
VRAVGVRPRARPPPGSEHGRARSAGPARRSGPNHPRSTRGTTRRMAACASTSVRIESTQQARARCARER